LALTKNIHIKEKLQQKARREFWSLFSFLQNMEENQKKEALAPEFLTIPVSYWCEVLFV
jgi:hypothetical protein